jgi:hypothetical protein
LYGGRYYDDERLGAYLVSSIELDSGPVLVAEALSEHYPSYRFAGIGAHLLWPAGDWGDVGLVGSLAWETYEAYADTEIDYQTRILGAEWEFERGPWAVAVQAGKYVEGYADTEAGYASADLYFWGANYDWYLRGATRRISDKSLNLLEAYRVFNILERSVTGYVGTSADDLDVVSPGASDAIYAGAYAELFSHAGSTITLWFEAVREDHDSFITLELNLAFGDAVRMPYITAFGFSLDD